MKHKPATLKEFHARIREQERRAKAYPRLVAEARESQVTLAIALDALRKANLPGQEAAVLEQINATSALLRELGEDA